MRSGRGGSGQGAGGAALVVQAEKVVESHELGQWVEEIAKSFDLNPADVRAVVSFATAELATRHDR
jgi:uncharacterized protein (DUF433 family)